MSDTARRQSKCLEPWLPCLEREFADSNLEDRCLVGVGKDAGFVRVVKACVLLGGRTTGVISMKAALLWAMAEQKGCLPECLGSLASSIRAPHRFLKT